jgi:hypothetical protein
MLFIAMVLSTIIIVQMWWLLSASLPVLVGVMLIYAAIVSWVLYKGSFTRIHK